MQASWITRPIPPLSRVHLAVEQIEGQPLFGPGLDVLPGYLHR